MTGTLPEVLAPTNAASQAHGEKRAKVHLMTRPTSRDLLRTVEVLLSGTRRTRRATTPLKTPASLGPNSFHVKS